MSALLDSLMTERPSLESRVKPIIERARGDIRYLLRMMSLNLSVESFLFYASHYRKQNRRIALLEALLR